MYRPLTGAVALVLIVLSGCDAAPDPAGNPRPSASPHSTASERLSAADGGVVRGPQGTELVVPPGVLSEDGAATITVYRDATVDFHIGVLWSGQVQVRMPAPDAETGAATLIGHQIRDTWNVEDTYYADGYVVAWVSTLSLFKKFACVKRLVPKDIVTCLIREGIKDLPSSLAKKLGIDTTDCGYVLDLTTWLGDGACKAGDPPTPWPTFTRRPPAAPTTAPPPAVKTTAPLPPANRFAVASYDRLAAGALYAEWYQAWQNFSAATNTLTRLAINVGDPRWAPGPIGVSTTLRLCRDSGCSQQLGAWVAQINNYGSTAVDIGDFTAEPGTTYYLRFDRPDGAHSWAVYFWGPGTYNNLSASIHGYNR